MSQKIYCATYNMSLNIALPRGLCGLVLGAPDLFFYLTKIITNYPTLTPTLFSVLSHFLCIMFVKCSIYQKYIFNSKRAVASANESLVPGLPDYQALQLLALSQPLRLFYACGHRVCPGGVFLAL